MPRKKANVSSDLPNEVVPLLQAILTELGDLNNGVAMLIKGENLEAIEGGIKELKEAVTDLDDAIRDLKPGRRKAA